MSLGAHQDPPLEPDPECEHKWKPWKRRGSMTQEGPRETITLYESKQRTCARCHGVEDAKKGRYAS